MKSRTNLTKIALLLFLTYSSTTLCQTHNIVLEVDTEKVICGEVEKYTKFKGQADGELNKDFTVEVDKGDKIAWQAVDISPIKRRVVVKQIRYESGDRLFKNDNFNKQWWRSRRLVERIKKNTNYGQEEKYALVFSFRKDGVKYSYIIDPKLVIRKKED